MRATSIFAAGAAAALAGVVLLVIEVARALGGNVLGGTAEALLWVGVGLLVVGGALLVLTVARAAAADAAPGSAVPDADVSDRGVPANG